MAWDEDAKSWSDKGLTTLQVATKLTLKRTWTYVDVRRRTSTYVNVRRCTSTYVVVRRRMSTYGFTSKPQITTRQRGGAEQGGTYVDVHVDLRRRTSTCVHVRPRTSTYVHVRRRTSTYIDVRRRTSTYVDVRRHTSTYVDVRRCTSTYVDQIFEVSFVRVVFLGLRLM